MAEPAAKTETLPRWNLADLYQGIDSPAIGADLAAALAESKTFRKEFEGRLASLDGDAFAGAIKRYEAIQEKLGRVMSYAQLVYAEAMTDPKHAKFYQSSQERVTDISVELLFFTLEINCI